MKKKFTVLTTICLTCYSLSMAQNVGINTTGAAPAASAMLDIDAATRGLLIPRVALIATNAAGPIAAPATSLLVYNTAIAGVAPNNVTPGYYYWDGAAWVRFNTGATTAWEITGNANATSGTHFLGTTNAQALDFRTNNTLRFRVANGNQVHALADGTAAAPFYSWGATTTMGMYRIGANVIGFSTSSAERMRILANGSVAVNTPAPVAGDLFVSTAVAGNEYSINGYNALATGSAIYATSTGATNAFSAIEGDKAASPNGAGVYGIQRSPTVAAGGTAGVMGTYIGTSNTGIRIGVRGTSDRGAGNQQIGVLGSYNGTGYGIGVYGLGFGGGFVAGNLDFAVVGWSANNSNFSGYFNGNHVIANGTKTASVGTSKGNQLLYVTELPEVWFEDVGSAKLENGYCEVKLDPMFLETIFVDANHPMQVFLQEQGESNGLYVIPGTDGFIVKEKNNGNSNINFSYRIMAKRLHFQDHRFGNDPVWGPGDTRKFNQYATPPPVDYYENLKFQEDFKKNYVQPEMPEGFVPSTVLTLPKTRQDYLNSKTENRE